MVADAYSPMRAPVHRPALSREEERDFFARLKRRPLFRPRRRRDLLDYLDLLKMPEGWKPASADAEPRFAVAVARGRRAFVELERCAHIEVATRRMRELGADTVLRLADRKVMASLLAVPKDDDIEGEVRHADE